MLMYDEMRGITPRRIEYMERYESFKHLLDPAKYNGREVVGVKGSSTMTYPLPRRNKRR